MPNPADRTAAAITATRALFGDLPPALGVAAAAIATASAIVFFRSKD